MTKKLPAPAPILAVPSAVDAATGRPMAYPRDAVLTMEQVLAWLGIGERTFYRWGIRHANRLVVAAWVYDALEKKAAA